MKKILFSASLIAAGATTLQAQYGLSPVQAQKPWSISATLRGFYDDNYTTTGRGVRSPITGASVDAPDSFGFELSPSVSINLPLEQTFIGASYQYSMRYFEDRPNSRADHTHKFNVKLDHAFNPRYKLELSDSFVIAQEPQVIDEGILATPLRTEGDNIRNLAKATFTARLTELLGLQLGYQNTLYDYEQDGVASKSALLDRLEHLALLNLRWQMMPQTVGILGYNFGYVDYTSDDDLVAGPPAIEPDVRNNRSHYVYVGADHNFNSQLNGSIRAGGRYTEYYKSTNDADEVSPYVDGNLTYAFAPGSNIQVGVRHDRFQTDIFAADAGGDFTLDQQATAIYGSLTHKLTANVTAGLIGQYQNSVFEGGAADDQEDDFFTAGLNLAYQINPYLVAEAGYNYDKLNSDLGDRGYTRNRVYVGIRATY